MTRIVLLMMIIATGLPAKSYAGTCDHSWQTASNGSRCGDRAADKRQGGN